MAKKQQKKSHARGRPLTADEPKIRVEVWITPTARERARALGAGNVSRGVEAALRIKDTV